MRNQHAPVSIECHKQALVRDSPREEVRHDATHAAPVPRPRSVRPEVELADLLGAVIGLDREVDPPADPDPPGGRHRRVVETQVDGPHGAVTEGMEIPLHRVREHRLLLGLEVGAESGELRWRRDPELGVGVTRRGHERVAEPGSVNGIVRRLRALVRARETPGAHRVGPAEEVGRHPGEALVELHVAQGKARFRVGSVSRLHGSPSRERSCGSPSAPTMRATASRST